MYKAAVIGLGQIGLGYDYNVSVQNDQLILTHSSAYWHHPNFELVAGVDSCADARTRFTKKYGCPAYPDLAALFNTHKIDVVSLAVPAECRPTLFEELLQFSLKGILTEKPVANNFSMSQRLFELAAKKNLCLMVNFIRRYDPGIEQLRQDIQVGKIGKILKGVVWFPKGVFCNAIHYLDLLFYLFDTRFTFERLLKPCKSFENDYQFDFKIVSNQAEIYFMNSPSSQYYLSEMDILTDKGRVYYSEDGRNVSFREPKPDDVFKEINFLEENTQNYKTDFNRYQFHVLEAFHSKLNTPCAENITELRAEKLLSQIAKELKEKDHA